MRYRADGGTRLLLALALSSLSALPAIRADTIVELTGARSGDEFGWSGELAGDVNMDGHLDLLIGAPSSDMPDDYAGSCYLFEGPFDRATVRARQGDATFLGETFGDNLGVAVASAGDVNGDGFTDLLMGARGYDQPGIQAGRVYLFHGPVSGTLSAGQADAVFAGEEYDELGWALATNFDFNGDSIGDIALGAPESDLVGKAHIFFGPFSDMQSTTEADLTIVGAITFEELGDALAAGDFNNDGIDDLAIGGPGSNFGTATPGRVYVFLGPMSGTFSASAADVILEGEAVQDHFGISIDVGDFNGDGSDDLIVGADQQFGDAMGKCYIFYGPLLDTFSNASGADAVILSESSGEIEPGKFGAAVASIGDVNADGFDEVLIGDPWADDLSSGGVRSGAAYLFHGPLTGTIPSSQADRIFVGAPLDQMGASVAGAGDIDGNGVDDYLIGAPADSYSETEAGRTLLVLSRHPADLDEDGEVSFSDFSLFANCMLGPGIAHEDGCEYADLNADGDVDLGDYYEFQRLYSAAQR